MQVLDELRERLRRLYVASRDGGRAVEWEDLILVIDEMEAEHPGLVDLTSRTCADCDYRDIGNICTRWTHYGDVAGALSCGKNHYVSTSDDGFCYLFKPACSAEAGG